MSEKQPRTIINAIRSGATFVTDHISVYLNEKLPLRNRTAIHLDTGVNKCVLSAGNVVEIVKPTNLDEMKLSERNVEKIQITSETCELACAARAYCKIFAKEKLH